MKIKIGRILSLLLIGLLLLFPLQSYIVLAQALTEEELSQLSGSEVLISDINKAGAALNSEAPAYGKVETTMVADVNLPFTSALRFTTNVEPAGTYLLQYVIPINASIAKDDVMLATFYARTMSSTQETAEGKVSLVLEKTGTWEKSINETMSIPMMQWKKFLVPIKAALLMGVDSSQITFRLGYKPQVIEIADLKVVNYKNTVTIDQLPSTPVYYEGMEDDAPWRAEANQRIEQIRKGDLEIKVLDPNGQPVTNADVHVNMTKHDFKFGTAVNSSMIFGTDQNAQTYRDKLKENFNSVVMENEMKWPWWESDKSRTVKLYNWLGENQFNIRGHALLWDGSTRMPTDIGTILNDKAALDKRIQDHFHELAGYFRGRLYNWDVVNEPVLNKMIRSVYGDQIMADWFKIAKEADPTAKLYVNETQILGVSAPVIDTFSNLLQTLKDNGAPIDGIGIQAHFGSTPVSPMAFYNQLTHFSQYAPEIAITEFDVNSPREDVQAKFTRDLLLATFSHPNVNSFTMWGFWDGAHWQNNAPLFRTDWSLKPSGEQWRKFIYETWWTNVSGLTDSGGLFKTRGFYGDYDITVTRDGISQTVKASLLKGQNNKVSVVWGVPAEQTAHNFVPLPLPAQNADITAPVWPYGSVFGVLEASPTSVTLNWPNAHDNLALEGYLIYKDGSLITQTPANVTSYDVTGLSPRQTYSLTVQAVDNVGNHSVPSPIIQAVTTSGTDITRPGWKKGSFLSVSGLSQTGALLAWPAGVDNVGTASYRIYVNGQITGNTAGQSFALTGLTENNLYTVRVEAKDWDGNLSLGGPIVTFRTLGAEDTTPPAWSNQTSLTASEITTNSVNLNWSAAQDARGVSAYRLFKGNEELVTLPASMNTFRLNGLSPNTTYSFKVEAGDSNNNWSSAGPALTIKTNADADETAPFWPDARMLTYSSLSDRSVSLNWTPADDNIGVTAYRLYSDNSVIASVYGNVQNFTVTNLEPNHLQTFRVEAGDAAGNWSSTGPSVAVTTSAGVVRTTNMLYPSDDAFIQAPAALGGDGTTNNIAYIRFKNAAGASGSEQNKNTGNNRRAYLKFPLNSVTGSVYEASLNLYVFAVQTPNKDISMDLYQTGDNWSETGINWKNKPADGAKLASSIVRNAGYWKKFIVTDNVATEKNGDQMISFKLQDDTWLDQNVDIHSKEASGANAAFKPYLLISTEAVPTDQAPPVWIGATLDVSRIKPHTATLTWSGATDQSGINRYNIYRNGVAIAAVGSDVHSYEVKGLNASTAYTFKIEAQDAAQESTGGPSVSLTTPGADQIAPVWPASAALTAQDVSRTAVTLQWTDAQDEYGVEEYAVYNGNIAVATVTGNVYRVVGLPAGSENLFRVSARDAGGNETFGPSILVTTHAPDTIKPVWSSGSLLTPSDVTSSGIMLSWPSAIDETGVTRYQIYMGGSKVAEVAHDINSYYMTGLNSDTPYTFRVVALDEAGNLSQPLELNQIRTLKQDTITPQWPTGSRIISTLESDRATLHWDAAVDNLGIKHYFIYRDGALIVAVEGNTSRYTVMGAPDAAAVYKVEAQDYSGNATVIGPSTNDPEIPVPSDTTPPGWPAGSKLTAEAVTSTWVKLSWSLAIDRMGVTQYKLLMDGNVVRTTADTHWLVYGLAANTQYDFKVEAADAAGNWSNNGPSLKVRTTGQSSSDDRDKDKDNKDKEKEKEREKEKDKKKDSSASVNSQQEVRITIPSQSLTMKNGKVSTMIDKSSLVEAFNKSKEQTPGESRVAIDLSKVAGAKAYAIDIPADFLTKKDSLNNIEVLTELGSLTLPGSMLANNKIAAEQENITVSIALAELPEHSAVRGKTGVVLDLQVASNGQPLIFENKDTFVKVRISYPLSEEERRHAELLNVWYVNDKGEVQLVPTGRYDLASGEMRFQTNHFSKYAVSYVNQMFEDLAATPWAQKSIEALASKGIIKGITERTFNPASSISRADFTKLLIETFNLASAFDNPFEDVKRDDYYYKAVGVAHKLGIVVGKDNSHFYPNELITRQDMFLMISRALFQVDKQLPNMTKAEISGYLDQSEIADYAVEAVSSMVKEGLVEGSSGRLNPLRNSTRAEASVMLYKLFNYVFK